MSSGPANGGDARLDLQTPISVPDRRRAEFQSLRADGQRMLTLEEAAFHLNTTVATVRKLIRCHALRAVQYSPRVSRIPESSVVAFRTR